MLDNTAKKKYNKFAKKYNDENIWSAIELFHKNRDKFSYRDIYKYSAKSLWEEIKTKNIHSKRELKYNGSKEVLNEIIPTTYKVIRFDTYESCKRYLSNTKLCITNKKVFFDNTIAGTIFYMVVINSKFEELKYVIPAFFNVNRRCIDDICYDSLDDEYPINVIPNNILELIETDLNSICICGVYYGLAKTKNDELFSKFADEFKEIIIDRLNDSSFEVFSFLQDTINNNPRLALQKLPFTSDNIKNPDKFSFISKKNLAQNLDLYVAQKLFAHQCFATEITKLNYNDSEIKQILINRCKKNNAIKNKCQSLGLIPKSKKKSAPKNTEKDEIAALKKKINKLEKQIARRK